MPVAVEGKVAVAQGRVSNPFVRDSDAERYARGRPRFHAEVLERVGKHVPLEGTLALDVGCGIGLSSVALARFCRRVMGVDSSRAMLGRAPRAERVDYLVAKAENLPARDAQFDVITLGQVAHWIDWPAFLREASRVARPGGWVVVYDHFLDGDDASANGPLAAWLERTFRGRYPGPPRHAVTLESPESWEAEGFELLSVERYKTTAAWTQAELVDYLTTQSNVIAALGAGADSIEGARQWLREETSGLFAGATERTIAFSGPILCARRGA